jgi:hypothetical protein
VDDLRGPGLVVAVVQVELEPEEGVARGLKAPMPSLGPCQLWAETGSRRTPTYWLQTQPLSAKRSRNIF